MYSDGKLIVYEVERATAGITLGLHSRFPSPLVATVDCSDSENVRSHLDSLLAKVHLQSGQCVVAHHLAPIRAEDKYVP